MGRLRYDLTIDTGNGDAKSAIIPVGAHEIEVINKGTVNATITQHVPDADRIITIAPDETYTSPYVPDVCYPAMTYNDGGAGGNMKASFVMFYNS